MLAVSDTGVGMDAETRARAFDPFFTTKAVGKGTGLGLATVYGIVKQSDGDVWAYSELGRGTTFKVYFPRTGEAPKAEGSAVSSEQEPGGADTVLLAEDEDLVRGSVADMLRQVGYTVVEAANGQAALAVARAHPAPIALLVTDVVMPGMGGRDLAQTLAAEQPALRVLFLSGYTDDAVVRHGILEHRVAFLQKPFTRPKLLAKVREVLQGPPFVPPLAP
jgi:CheY-like chemotaxis protein